MIFVLKKRSSHVFRRFSSVVYFNVSCNDRTSSIQQRVELIALGYISIFINDEKLAHKHVETNQSVA